MQTFTEHAGALGTYYVDGAGQLCTTTCTTPMPEELKDIDPPF